MTKEALRLALEALKTIDDAMPFPVAKLAIKECTAALEAKDEPVAFKIYKPTPSRHATPNVQDAELPWVYDQDPSSGNVASMWVTPVKATPPQRTWVGLTDEEAQQTFARHNCTISTHLAGILARAIEAKLRSKTHGRYEPRPFRSLPNTTLKDCQSS